MTLLPKHLVPCSVLEIKTSIFQITFNSDQYITPTEVLLGLNSDAYEHKFHTTNNWYGFYNVYYK